MVACGDEAAKDVAHEEVKLAQGRWEPYHVHIGVVLLEDHVARLTSDGDALHNRVLTTGAFAFRGAEVTARRAVDIVSSKQYRRSERNFPGSRFCVRFQS